MGQMRYTSVHPSSVRVRLLSTLWRILPLWWSMPICIMPVSMWRSIPFWKKKSWKRRRGWFGSCTASVWMHWLYRIWGLRGWICRPFRCMAVRRWITVRRRKYVSLPMPVSVRWCWHANFLCRRYAVSMRRVPTCRSKSLYTGLFASVIAGSAMSARLVSDGVPTGGNVRNSAVYPSVW